MKGGEVLFSITKLPENVVLSLILEKVAWLIEHEIMEFGFFRLWIVS